MMNDEREPRRPPVEQDEEESRENLQVQEDAAEERENSRGYQ